MLGLSVRKSKKPLPSGVSVRHIDKVAADPGAHSYCNNRPKQVEFVAADDLGDFVEGLSAANFRIVLTPSVEHTVSYEGNGRVVLTYVAILMPQLKIMVETCWDRSWDAAITIEARALPQAARRLIGLLHFTPPLERTAFCLNGGSVLSWRVVSGRLWCRHFTTANSASTCWGSVLSATKWPDASSFGTELPEECVPTGWGTLLWTFHHAQRVVETTFGGEVVLVFNRRGNDTDVFEVTTQATSLAEALVAMGCTLASRVPCTVVIELYARSGELTRRFDAIRSCPRGSSFAVKFLPDGQRLLLAQTFYFDTEMLIYDLHSTLLLYSYSTAGCVHNWFGFCGDSGSEVFIGGIHLHVHCAATGKLLRQTDSRTICPSYTRAVTVAAGDLLVVGEDGSLYVFE